MKRLLLVAPYVGVPGGISRWTSHLLNHYKSTKDGRVELDLVDMGRSMFVNINMSFLKRMRYAWIDYRKIFSNFHKEVKSGNYDVMHLTSSGSLSLYKDLYMLEVAKRNGIKTVLHFRFGRIPDLSEKNNWEWKMIKKVIKVADKVIVIDNASCETLISQGFNNITLLPNPLTPAIEKIIEDNRGIKHNKREILFAGHVVKTKGIFELLEACSTIPDIHLCIVGYITDDIRGQILAKHGFNNDWFTIYGEKPYEDVIKGMMSCELFVLPTYTEGFPNVILEAMATGCAIITTPVGAIPEMLDFRTEKSLGIEVPVKDVDKLREAIVFGLSHPEEMRRMGESAHEKVLECYSMQKIWSKMLDIWEN